MATRVSENPETNAYYAAQAALAFQAAQALQGLSIEFDPLDLPGSVEFIKTPSASVGSHFSLMGISLAADYYDAFREWVGETSRFRVPIIDAPTAAEIEAKIDAEVSGLLGELTNLVDDIYVAELTLQLEAQIAGTVETSVVDSGSAEIFAAIKADRAARGWARITRPDACSFCRMLAQRGAVYRSEASAGFRAHSPVRGRGGVCRCGVEPVIGSYEMTAQARADEAVWEQVSLDGFRGKAAVNEFRRRVEGRTDGPRRAGSSGPTAAPTTKRLGFDALTVADLKHQLTILEKLQATLSNGRPNTYREQQMARVHARIAALAA